MRHGVITRMQSPRSADVRARDPHARSGTASTRPARAGDAVVGILNGVDYDEWNPATDVIPHRFDANDLTGKLLDKDALLDLLGCRRRGRR